MKVQVRMFRGPGWIVPALVLIALALLPFALMLAAGLAFLAVGAAALSALLPGARRPLPENDYSPRSRKLKSGPEAGVIDADYEVVKEDHEKK